MPKVAEPPGRAGSIQLARERTDRVRDLTAAAAVPGNSDLAVDAHLHSVDRAQEHAVHMGVNLVDLPAMNPKPLRPGQVSQGTLWDPRAMKPSDEHRWAAHGYSPERRDAIAAAIPDRGTQVGISPQHTGGDVFGAYPEFAHGGRDPETNLRTRTVPPTRAKANQRTQARNALVDVLARSTAPLEDITTNTPKFKIRAGVEGRYRLRPFSTEKAVVQIDPEQDRVNIEHAIVHELGHHADYESGRSAFVARAGQRVRGASPALEGAAEGYAAKHHVQRHNDPHSPYHLTASYTWFHGRKSFQDRFKAVSGMDVDQAMGAQKMLGEQWRQPHLFEKEQPPEISDEDWKHLTHRPPNNFILRKVSK